MIVICNMWKEQNWPNNNAKTVQGHAKLIMDHNAIVEKVEEVWNRLHVILLGRKQFDSLNTIRSRYA